MNQLRSSFYIFGLMVIAFLVSACGASAEPAAPTSAPTSAPEPPTATSLQTESQGPTKSSEVPRMSVEKLKERLDNGEAIVVVDSRSKSEYDTKHIAGAISVPENYDEYPLDQEIIFYCT
jgi:hypothetical protein